MSFPPSPRRLIYNRSLTPTGLREVAISVQEVDRLRDAGKSLISMDKACAKLSANRCVLLLGTHTMTHMPDRAQATQLTQRCAALLNALKEINPSAHLDPPRLQECHSYACLDVSWNPASYKRLASCPTS